MFLSADRHRFVLAKRREAVVIPELTDFPLYEGLVIAQPDGDLGDAPQRTAMYYIGRAILGVAPDPAAFRRAASLLQDGHGRLIRDPVKWNDPHDISRDQEEPWTIACALYGRSHQARMVIFRRWRRLGFFPNFDLENPSGLAVDLRILNWWLLWPLILFGDFWSVLTALFDCIHVGLRGERDGPWLDMDNAVTRLAYASIQLPTPLAWLARKIYRYGFPRGVHFAILNKHRLGVGNPAMFRLWFRVLDQW